MTGPGTAATPSTGTQVLFVHPAASKSRINVALRAALGGMARVTVRDLYALYPDFDIDVAAEQQTLLAHDCLVLQFPFYWYSSPALLKQWLDLVLEFGWAYGPGADALRGRRVMLAISTGGRAGAYRHDGANRFTMTELLRPFEQAFHLCGMHWLEPFVIHGSRAVTDHDLETVLAPAYRSRVAALVQPTGAGT